MISTKNRFIIIGFIFLFIKTSDSFKNEADIMRLLNDPVIKAHLAEKEKLDNEKANLTAAREALDAEKKVSDSSISTTDIIRLNVAGEIIMTTRSTVTRLSSSFLTTLFNGKWDEQLTTDPDGNIFLDFNPTLVRYLLEQLRMLKDDESRIPYPPKSSHYSTRTFERMLKKFCISSVKPMSNDLIVLNVGGESMLTRYKTLTQMSQSKLASLVTETTSQRDIIFIEQEPHLFRHLMTQLRETDHIIPRYFKTLSSENKIGFEKLLKSFELDVMTTTTTTTTTTTSTTTPYTVESKLTDRICRRATWDTNGMTIAGGNGDGNKPIQLSSPRGIFVDDDHNTLYIADTGNDRIVKWSIGTSIGLVVAGGVGKGHFIDQLSSPTDIVVTKNETMYICDSSNSRVQRWLPRAVEGETISRIVCSGLALDNEESLYVTDILTHRVIKWPGEQVVAGGNGKGAGLDQLNHPEDVFVDEKQTVYVIDKNNNRIMKWAKGAKTGVIEVITKKIGTTTYPFDRPDGIIVDRMGSIYVAHAESSSISRSISYDMKPVMIIGGSGKDKKKLLNHPVSLAFDRVGNLYVSEQHNHRIQMFTINLSNCYVGGCGVG